MATKPVFSGSSTADKEAYKQQLLDYYVQSGDTSPTVVSDIKYGNLNYGNINKAGTLEYSLFNPVATAKTSTGLTEANQIFSSATGKQLTGDGLVAVEGALRQGYSATDALKNLGDLSNYAKFSTDYTGGTSGGPAGPAGTDFSKDPSFWEASPGVTTPQAASVVTPEQRAALANAAVSGTQVLPVDTSQKSPVKTATNTVKGYDVNNNYAEVWVKPGEYVPGVSLTKPTITPDSMESVKGVTLPAIQGGTLNQADAMVAGAGSTMESILKEITPSETPEDKQKQGILDLMLKELQSNDGLEAEKLKAEQAAGLPEIRQQLADINAQILSKTAEYNVLQAANANKPITMNSIIGNERAILNAKAADIGFLEARALGIQGKIDAAQQKVNDAINLKFAVQQHRLDIYQAQLNALQPTLDKQERLRAQAQQILVDRQNQAIADAKQSEKDEKDYLLDLMSKYPDAKISLTDSIESAQSKVSTSRIYQQDTRLAGGGGGGGGTIDFGTFPISPTTTTPTETVPATFEEYLAQQEAKAYQTFGPEKRAALLAKYESLKSQPQIKGDVSKYPFAVQRVIQGYATPESILSGGTAKERATYQKWLNQAANEGLLNQGLSEPQKKVITSINDSVSKNANYARTISMQNFVNNTQAALSLSTGAGDLAAINQFQKVIDEGAVTRDQDVKLIQSSQSLLNTLNTKVKKLQKGEQLSPELRQQMNQAVQALYDAQVKALQKDPYIKSKVTEAKNSNVNVGETILGEILTIGSQSSNQLNAQNDPVGVRSSGDPLGIR